MFITCLELSLVFLFIKNITQNNIQENTQTPTLNENNTMQNKNLRNIQLASIDIDR